MIHPLKLSPLTRRRLTVMVHLQMDLLYFAIVKGEEAIVEDELQKSACKEYFAQGECLYDKLCQRGETIVEWLWERPTLKKHLEDFARACREIDVEEGETPEGKAKAWWFQLYVEAMALLDTRCTSFSSSYPFAGKPPLTEQEQSKKKKAGILLDYREYAQDFFLYFYEKYLGNSGNEKQKPSAFPAEFFPQKDARPYGRREFLDEFIKHNPGLEICPCCDEHRLYIRNKATTRTEIDHFLPKEKYPHLAIHPYNLVPVCHHCNSSTKLAHDPLEKRIYLSRDHFFLEKRTHLSRNLFPYGKTKLRHYGRLTLDNKQTSSNAEGERRGKEFLLQPHKDHPTESSETNAERDLRLLEVQDAIDLLEHLYGIPERWHTMRKMYFQVTDNLDQEKESQTLQAMLMSETLVRRIGQFLSQSERFLGLQEQDTKEELRGNNALLAQVILRDLKHLLYYIDHDDQGKDPFAFAMTWILASKIREEIQPSALSEVEYSPLVDEITNWFLQHTPTHKQRAEHVEKLLKRLEE